MPGINRDCTRRLSRDRQGEKDPPVHPLTKRPDEGKQTFRPVPRRWTAVDIDKLPLPPSLDWRVDPQALVRFLTDQLPAAFRGVRCILQLTASTGLPGSEGRISARLWFWLSRGVTNSELKLWLCEKNHETKLKEHPVDGRRLPL